MATLKLLIPFAGMYPVTQTYDQHVARAKANGWSWAPGVPGNGYYYGGIDFGMPNGTPIRATREGKVEKAALDASGYGHHVRISHETVPGLSKSIYGHLSNLAVVAGDMVQAGQLIGYSDNTGMSTGPHLHFECRNGGTPFDPAPYLVDSLDPGDPGTELPPSIPIDEPIPGGPVRVIVDELRLRAEPGLAGFIAGKLQAGAVINITAPSQEITGYRWRKLDSQDLYVAEISLSTGERYLEA